MSPNDAVAVIRKQLDAFNARDFEAFAKTVAEDVAYHDFGSGAEVSGREAFVAATTGYLSVWSDVQAKILNIVDGGDQVVVEARWVGTHDGDLSMPGGTIPASGRPIAVDAVIVAKLAGGVITHMNYYFNMLPVLQQLGAPVG